MGTRIVKPTTSPGPGDGRSGFDIHGFIQVIIAKLLFYQLLVLVRYNNPIQFTLNLECCNSWAYLW
jgi:hypothetical protein